MKTELNPGVCVDVFPLQCGMSLFAWSVGWLFPLGGLPLTSGCGLVGSVEIGPSFSGGGWSFLLRVRAWPFLLEVGVRLFLLGVAGWPFFLMVGVGLPPENGGWRIRLGVRSGPPLSGRTIAAGRCQCYQRQLVRVRMPITIIASSDQVLHLHLFLCWWHVISSRRWTLRLTTPTFWPRTW